MYDYWTLYLVVAIIAIITSLLSLFPNSCFKSVRKSPTIGNSKLLFSKSSIIFSSKYLVTLPIYCHKLHLTCIFTISRLILTNQVVLKSFLNESYSYICEMYKSYNRLYLLKLSTIIVYKIEIER